MEKEIIIKFLEVNNWLSLENKENASKVIDVYLEHYSTPPNLDNLFEVAREEAFKLKSNMPTMFDDTDFTMGAKFIIDKLKEVGSYSCKASDVSDREKHQDPYSPTANWIQPYKQD